MYDNTAEADLRDTLARRIYDWLDSVGDYENAMDEIRNPEHNIFIKRLAAEIYDLYVMNYTD